MNLDALMSPYTESARHRADYPVQPRHRADVLHTQGEEPAYEFAPRHRADRYAA